MPQRAEDPDDWDGPKLLELTVEAARVLPPEPRDDIARMVLQLAGNELSPVTLSTQERAAPDCSKAAAARREVAPAAEAPAALAERGL